MMLILMKISRCALMAPVTKMNPVLEAMFGTNENKHRKVVIMTEQ